MGCFAFRLKPIGAEFNKPLLEYGQPALLSSERRKTGIGDDGNKGIPTEFGFDLQLLSN